MSKNTEDKRHVYEYAVDLNANTASARVIRMVGKNKKVLEIGAVPGSITKHLRHANACRITALELDGEAIKKLSPFCERVYQPNLNDTAWTRMLENEGRFEVVVATDVLEHLYDPLGPGSERLDRGDSDDRATCMDERCGGCRAGLVWSRGNHLRR